MDKLESGSCEITLQDKIDTPVGMVDNLVWLKYHGAPILGSILLRLDPRYEIRIREDASKCSTHVTWEPI